MDEKLMTPQLMKDIEEYSLLMFSKREIAEILEIPSEGFMELLEKNEQAFKAFRKGRLVQEAKLRKAVFDLAGLGGDSIDNKSADPAGEVKRRAAWLSPATRRRHGPA